MEATEANSIAYWKAKSYVIEVEGCLVMLERAGRHYLGPNFTINPADYQVLFQLLVYFYHELQSTEGYGIDLKKGILPWGPVGCGKTTVMFLMRLFLPEAEQYTMVSTRDVGLEYQREGYAVIEKYASRSFFFRQGDIRPKTYCFDDLGLEANIRHFGSDTNIMAEKLTKGASIVLAGTLNYEEYAKEVSKAKTVNLKRAYIDVKELSLP